MSAHKLVINIQGVQVCFPVINTWRIVMELGRSVIFRNSHLRMTWKWRICTICDSAQKFLCCLCILSVSVIVKWKLMFFRPHISVLCVIAFISGRIVCFFLQFSVGGLYCRSTQNELVSISYVCSGRTHKNLTFL